MKKVIVTAQGQQEVELTPQEILALEQEQAAWVAGAAKRDIEDKIKKLELQVTPRRMREAVLGEDNGWLLNIEQQIKELRGL